MKKHKSSFRVIAILLLLMAISCQQDTFEEDLLQDTLIDIEETETIKPS